MLITYVTNLTSKQNNHVTHLLCLKFFGTSAPVAPLSYCGVGLILSVGLVVNILYSSWVARKSMGRCMSPAVIKPWPWLSSKRFSISALDSPRVWPAWRIADSSWRSSIFVAQFSMTALPDWLSKTSAKRCEFSSNSTFRFRPLRETPSKKLADAGNDV